MHKKPRQPFVSHRPDNGDRKDDDDDVHDGIDTTGAPSMVEQPRDKDWKDGNGQVEEEYISNTATHEDDEVNDDSNDDSDEYLAEGGDTLSPLPWDASSTLSSPPTSAGEDSMGISSITSQGHNHPHSPRSPSSRRLMVEGGTICPFPSHRWSAVSALDSFDSHGREATSQENQPPPSSRSSSPSHQRHHHLPLPEQDGWSGNLDDVGADTANADENVDGSPAMRILKVKSTLVVARLRLALDGALEDVDSWRDKCRSLQSANLEMRMECAAKQRRIDELEREAASTSSGYSPLSSHSSAPRDSAQNRRNAKLVDL